MFAWQGLPGPLLLLLLLLALIRQISILPVAGASPGDGPTSEPWHPTASGGRGQRVPPASPGWRWLMSWGQPRHQPSLLGW